MSIEFKGFTGPSYAYPNVYAAVERCVNWYCLANESPDEGKWQMALAPCPGNAPFSRLPVPSPFNHPCRGLIELRGEVFGVNGAVVFWLQPGGGMVYLGQIANDGKPVTMSANGNGQIFIASAGLGYIINGGVLAPVLTTEFLGASDVTFQDGYTVVLTPAVQPPPGHPTGTQQFQWSGDDNTPVGDAGIWSAANIIQLKGQADNLVRCISRREYLRFFGERRSQIFVNVGATGIGGAPFQSYNETFIENGCAAAASLAWLKDSYYWILQDESGAVMCMRDTAFNPQRISNFAVEQAWAGYSTISDAVAFGMIYQGHAIYSITFPTAQKTWWYDATVSALIGRACWTERNYTDSQGNQIARPEQFHVYAFGKHLVGSVGTDGNPGAVYEYKELGSLNEDPQILLRWSVDAGRTWKPEQTMALGRIGQYSRRVYYNRMGYGRDWVIWVRYADETECGTDITGAQSQQPIVRDRISPHVFAGNQRVFVNRFELEVTRGVGADGQSANPYTCGIVGAEITLIQGAS